MRRRRRSYTRGKKESKWNMNMLGNILLWIFQIAVVLLMAFVLVFYAGEQISNIGDSMSPTLENGDVVLVNRFVYKVTSPKQGDLVVFRPNGNVNAHFYITRVVADYFVIGDNPDSSEDSRYTDIGNVKLSDIEGKAWYVLSPRKRRGKL